MFTLFRNWTKKRALSVGLAIILSVSLALSGTQIEDRLSSESDSDFSVGIGQKVITIGPVAYAAGTADYTVDGVADDVQFQAALNALPANGGKISVLSGNYVFAATVTRAIPNVTIEGNGYSTNFTYDGVNPIFTAGGNNWVFSRLVTDAGGVNMGATTGWMWTKVNDGVTAYDLRTPAASVINGVVVVSSLTDSGLTNGRVPIAGVGGLLGDSANLTWSATTLTTTTANITTLNAPTGRGATIIIATANAEVSERNQADYILTGTNDDVLLDTIFATLPRFAGLSYEGRTGSVTILGKGVQLGSRFDFPPLHNFVLNAEEVQFAGVGQIRFDSTMDVQIRIGVVSGNASNPAVEFAPRTQSVDNTTGIFSSRFYISSVVGDGIGVGDAVLWTLDDGSIQNSLFDITEAQQANILFNVPNDATASHAISGNTFIGRNLHTGTRVLRFGDNQGTNFVYNVFWLNWDTGFTRGIDFTGQNNEIHIGRVLSPLSILNLVFATTDANNIVFSPLPISYTPNAVTNKVIMPTSNSGVRVYSSVSQNISDSTVTALSFNQESYDDNSQHGASSNNITVILPGLYSIRGVVMFTNNATGNRIVYITVNATDIALQRAGGDEFNAQYLEVSAQYRLVAGDLVFLRAYQSSGGSMALLNDGVLAPVLEMVRLGD